MLIGWGCRFLLNKLKYYKDYCCWEWLLYEMFVTLHIVSIQVDKSYLDECTLRHLPLMLGLYLMINILLYWLLTGSNLGLRIVVICPIWDMKGPVRSRSNSMHKHTKNGKLNTYSVYVLVVTIFSYFGFSQLVPSCSFTEHQSELDFQSLLLRQVYPHWAWGNRM